MSILATNDITNDMETGRGDGAATVESSGLFADTAKKDKQYIKPSVIATAALMLIIVGLVSYYSTSNSTNLATAASSSTASIQQKQNRHLIDLSSWFTALSSPTQSPTRKPSIDVSDWAEALKVTPSPTRFPTNSPSKQPTQPPSPPPSPPPTNDERPDRDGYITLINESFTRGYGLFGSNHSISNIKHYLSTWGLNMGEARSGVVRIIHDGSSTKKAELTSNEIRLADKDVSKIKISFTFLSIGMESSDSLCLDYAFDGGAITGKRCWTKAMFEKNGIWLEMSHEFATTVNVQSLVVRLRVEGDDSLDDVLVDSVVVKGKA